MTDYLFAKRLKAMPNGCWEWQGSLSKDGYGKIKRKRRHIRAHRYAWMMWRGPIPEGMHVLHSCDNRVCCNPLHLWVGTNADSRKDKAEKGRAIVNRGMAKISFEIAREIRASSELGVDLARKYGVSGATISQVRSNKLWRE